jgi:hypothetical protein
LDFGRFRQRPFVCTKKPPPPHRPALYTLFPLCVAGCVPVLPPPPPWRVRARAHRQSALCAAARAPPIRAPCCSWHAAQAVECNHGTNMSTISDDVTVVLVIELHPCLRWQLMEPGSDGGAAPASALASTFPQVQGPKCCPPSPHKPPFMQGPTCAPCRHSCSLCRLLALPVFLLLLLACAYCQSACVRRHSEPGCPWHAAQAVECNHCTNM